MSDKETSLAFVERMERYKVRMDSVDKTRLIELAKTAALIDEHKLRISHYTPDSPSDDGEYGYRCWLPFDAGNEKVRGTLHEAVRAVADKIKEQA